MSEPPKWFQQGILDLVKKSPKPITVLESTPTPWRNLYEDYMRVRALTLEPGDSLCITFTCEGAASEWMQKTREFVQEWPVTYSPKPKEKTDD